MKLIILGSGTINSSPVRNASGYILIHGSGLALMDCGPGILTQIKKAGFDPLTIDTIFLSHFHLDHCADVFPLLLHRYLQQATSNQNLTITGPAGLKQWFSSQSALQGEWLQQSLPRLWEYRGKNFVWAGIPVAAHRTLHTDNSLAFRFETGQGFFYSGDTGLSDGLIRFASNTGQALLECSFPDAMKKTGHLCPSECADFAIRAKIKNLILTHIYPENDTKDLKQRMDKEYNGPIFIAQDFETYEL